MIGSGREQLRLAIERQFDLEELRTLCFELGIDYENLAGDKRKARVVTLLLEESEKTYRLNELLAYLKRNRPNFDWAKNVPEGVRIDEQLQVDRGIIASVKKLDKTVRVLDDKFSKVFGQMSSLSPTIEDARLEELKADIIKLANEKKKVRRIQNTLNKLISKKEKAHETDKPLVEEIEQHVAEILNALSAEESRVTPFPNHDVLNDFLDRIRVGPDLGEDQVQRIRKESQEVQAVIGEENISHLHRMYLRLNDQMKSRWPSLWQQ